VLFNISKGWRYEGVIFAIVSSGIGATLAESKFKKIVVFKCLSSLWG
jgi:hypothetical protein